MQSSTTTGETQWLSIKTWTKEYTSVNAGLRALSQKDGIRKYKGAYKAPKKTKKHTE